MLPAVCACALAIVCKSRLNSATCPSTALSFFAPFEFCSTSHTTSPASKTTIPINTASISSFQSFALDLRSVVRNRSRLHNRHHVHPKYSTRLPRFLKTDYGSLFRAIRLNHSLSALLCVLCVSALSFSRALLSHLSIKWGRNPRGP